MKRKDHTLLAFLLSSLIGVLLFYCIPFILSGYYVFLDNMSNKSFIGLKNIEDTLSNPIFQNGLSNTILFIGISIPLLIITSLFVALLLRKVSRLKGFATCLLMIPIVVPSGVTAFFWKCIFDVSGVLNNLLHTFGYPVVNIANTRWAMLIPVALFLWKNVGFSAVIFATGIGRIPTEYYEIASSEGAGRWQKFRHITLVYLTPTTFIVLILAFINSFKIFRELYILYGNYPSEGLYLLQHYMNNQFFSLNMQKLVSASYILFFIILLLVALLFHLQKKLSDTFTNLNLNQSAIHSNSSHKDNNASITVFIVALFLLVPILFTLAGSFMGSDEIFARYSFDRSAHEGLSFVQMSLLPSHPTLEQYSSLLTQNPTYLRFYWNSIFITVPVVIGQCTVSCLGAYAFERMRWKYKELLFFVYIVIMLMPLQVLLVPNYLVADSLGFLDSYWAIILPGIFNPLGVFWVRQQLKGFPSECIEAAQMCGANPFQTFFYIVLPNLKPAIASLAVLTFAEYWNVVDQAVVLLDSIYKQPLSIHLGGIIDTNPTIFFAASCFYLLPAMIVFLMGKDYLVDSGIMPVIKKSGA